MPLKRMSEFKREDYVYESPDGETYEITIIQTADRKYVEIKRGEDEKVQWDVEMLLDIADAVRQATQKPSKSNKPHQLKKPNIIDHREIDSETKTPSDTIQESVDESMESMENTDLTIAPVQSFSPEGVAAEIAQRKQTSRKSPPELKIKKAMGQVQVGDLL